ncbi:GRIP and coiled-coil domain-containing protein 2 [Etheostoma cragini]|uniref:GRIP and coiled-coil domain-containing protein 2 n=1 Tax=Etheostoma cragini TaxID=417921 RepID=UPI00155E069A|nr:GRIP and coiled-coil domain-containing protein 2 [Etheostoma cragini]
MEDPGGTGAEHVAPSPAGAAKSKLDTLPKDDLIKFAKKQMAALQKMKGRCADLEKEVESLKKQSKNNNSSDDSTLIQELTERMDALLLEKAEVQQSLSKSGKDLEKTKQQAKDNLAVLQGELDRVIEDHQRQIKTLESSIEESNNKHQEEVAYFQRLLKDREESDRKRESEREREQAIAKETTEEVRLCFEAQLETLRAELEGIQGQKSQEIAELQESHQRELTEAQQEVENLKEELAQKSLQHDEEMRALEEDFEMERERLLLLHEELTEQLALKDSYLQDVQEEDEEPARSSGIAKMLELSACTEGDSSQGDEEETEIGRLRAAMEELQAQNTMLRDELTLLSNVKIELEAEQERAKEEFQMEREEMEFKINELQMSRESAPSDPALTLDPDQQEVQGEFQQHSKAHKDRCESKESAICPEELRAQCESLTKERDSAQAECQHMREILQAVELELGEKTKDFVLQYKAMKEQGGKTLRELQEKMDELSQERDNLLVKVRVVTEENNTVMKNLEHLKPKLEASARNDQKLPSSVEEQTTLACELKQSVEELTRQNEEVLSQLQMKENMTQDLQEIVNMLTKERDEIQSQLQHREEEMQKMNHEGVKETERLLEEKEKEALQWRAKEEKKLESLKKEKEEEVQHLKEEREKMEESLKEEVERMRETVSTLELTIKDLSSEKVDLHQKLDEASSGLSKVQETRELLASKLAALEAQLEQETSEKNHLVVKLNSLTEETEQARVTITALEGSQSDLLRNSTEVVEELQARVDELEKERVLLKSSLEEAQVVIGLEEVEKELQARIADLEQERSMLRNNLEEVVNDTEGLQKDLEDMKSVNEKMHEENQRLQAHISLMTQEQEEKEKGEMETNMEKERRELKDQLAEKDSHISQLRCETAALQESAAQSASSEENATAEITKKIALLEKEHKEKDQKMNKIKSVAIKAKKELEISKKEVASLKEKVELLNAEREKVSSSMKDIIHGAEGYKNLQIDYDRQTEQLDKEREKVEEAERKIVDLTKRLSSAVTQNDTLSSEKDGLLASMETLRSTVRQLEVQNQELQRQSASLDRDLLAERAMKEQKIKDLSSATKEVEELTAQLRKQKQQSQQTAQELEQLRKEAQQSSLMDMEMADYERLVKELNVKLADRDECAKELKAQINALTQKEDTLKEKIETLKSQLDQGEEKTSKMKQLLVNTKKELADVKMQESSLMLLQAALKGELEAHQQQLESSKIEVCELTAERHRLQEQLRSALEQQQRTSSSLQQRINSLQQERDIARAELMATAGEFEGYKVRVHNVLKQQKSKTTAQSDGDSTKLEREQLSSQVEQLRSRLAESQQSLQSCTAELQQLQTEHDTLLERHNKILQETVNKEAELRERLLLVQSENGALKSDLSQVQADLSSQVESQRQTYREQLRKLQDDHRATVETLQGQMTRIEEQLFYFQSQNNSVAVQSGRKTMASDPQRRNTDQNQAGLGLMALSDLQSMAREEGEGMETTETESPSPALTPLPSLEQLLTSPDPKQEPFVWTVEPTKEELSQKLSTATRSMEHMNSLLHETEATNAVLMEQITLLKSEVRRLERNQEREKSVANLEYLKNVLLQFIFLQSGSERQALLPVIHTMLQLSPEEKTKLAAIAQGQEEGSGSRGLGWSSYLHSWSGIK